MKKRIFEKAGVRFRIRIQTHDEIPIKPPMKAVRAYNNLKNDFHHPKKTIRELSNGRLFPDTSEIREVSPDYISRVIESIDTDYNEPEDYESKNYDSGGREFEGLFLCKENDTWVAVDNTTGEAWTEEFPTKSLACRWLLGYFEYSDYFDKQRSRCHVDIRFLNKNTRFSVKHPVF